MTSFCLILIFAVPIAGGLLSLVLRRASKRGLHLVAGTALVLEALLVTALCLRPEASAVLFSMTDRLVISLRMDGISRLFLLIAAWGYLAAGLFAFRYLRDSEAEGSWPERNFFSFYLFSQAALMGMDLAANMITMYLFFEMLTLLSMPLVLHDRTPEAAAAALKYLFYSIGGAFLALGCLFILAGCTPSLAFTPGGYLTALQADDPLLCWAVFLGTVGFGAKAGLYPLHGWLPTAHPVAPAPASAVLSGIIAKAGVLAILRLIYCYAGAAFLRGTWVQTALVILSLLTVFMGSMMAYREKLLKKRLAYSSVSQISYALFGLFLMTPDGLTGGLMQVLFHAAVKICLFLTAGSMICLTGRKNADETAGLGAVLPKTFGAFTLASLSLIGIPPFAGFLSKWYLALGSLSSGLPVLDWLGPVILLISALLTAGYLLPVSIRAFFPGKAFRGQAAFKAQQVSSAKASGATQQVTSSETSEALPECAGEGGPLLWGPIAVLAGLSLLLGLCGQWITPVFTGLAAPLC